MPKHLSLRSPLEVEMLKKCPPFWRQAHSEVKMVKHHMFRPLLGVCFLCGRRAGFCTLSKVNKSEPTEWVCSSLLNDGRRGAFEEYLQRWISCCWRSTRDTWVKHVRSSSLWLREWLHFRASDREVTKVILRDRCGTLHDLASLFRGRRNILDTWSVIKSQNTLVQGHQFCT